MKCIKTLLAAFVAIALTTTPCTSEDKYVEDNLGRKWLVDPTTASTPGAGSGMGALIGLIDSDQPGYMNHMVDLQIIHTIQGGADSTGSQSITGFTVFYYPKTWLKVGPSVKKVLGSERDLLEFGVPVSIALTKDPFSDVLWRVNASLFSYTVDIGDDPQPVESPFSVRPALMFAIEVPMGHYSVEFCAGGEYPLSILGATEQEANAQVKKLTTGVAAAFNYRLR